MPEGDTIHDAADRLGRTFGSDPLASFEAPGLQHPHPSPGDPMRITPRNRHDATDWGQVAGHEVW